MSKKRFSAKLHVKKGDQVVITEGSYKGKTGKVLEVFPKKNRAVVEGVNIVKKHQKPTQNSEGGIIEKEASIHLSNIMLADPKSGEPTRIGRKLIDNKIVRYSKKSGEIIK